MGAENTKKGWNSDFSRSSIRPPILQPQEALYFRQKSATEYRHFRALISSDWARVFYGSAIEFWSSGADFHMLITQVPKRKSKSKKIKFTKSFFFSKENKLGPQFFWHNGMEVTFIFFSWRPLCLSSRPFSGDYLTMDYWSYH